MRVVLDGGVCCIPAASEADHSTKEVNTSYRNNIFDFQGTMIKTPNHFTTVGVWCTLTKVKLYCKLYGYKPNGNWFITIQICNTDCIA